MKYVLGFCFDDDCKQVVLILKVKPEWQAGKLNGVGGKREDSDETSNHAMAREFREETGVDTPPGAWKYFATMNFPGQVEVDCFAIASDKYTDLIRTTTAEVVLALAVNSTVIHQQGMPNLAWLIPMARDKVLNEASMLATINHYALR